MYVIDDETVVVYNSDDLRDAVSSDNGYNYVYFGADITLAYGITIYAGKTSLTIDGTYEGVRYRFTDYNNSAASYTLGIRSTSSLSLTIQNIDLTGRNYYGIPYVYEGANTDGVTVTYDHVSYTGVQMIYHQRGLTRFLDCDIHINGATSGYQEVGEVCKVEIGGNTFIRKANEQHGIFWFYGTSTRSPYLRILAGAQVEISTENYFMYETQPPYYEIEAGASLELYTQYGISYDAGHTITAFTLQAGASFRHIQADCRANNIASLYITGPLTAGAGSSLYMQNDYANNAPVIRFTTASASLTLTQPESFVLYNSGTGGNAAAFSFGSTTPFSITSGQINTWLDAAAFPLAGTFADRPQSKWYRSGWQSFSVSGSALSTTTVSSTTLTPEEQAGLPPLSDLQLQSARVFSAGGLFVEVDTVVAGHHVTGLTSPFAEVMVEYSTEGSAYSSYYSTDLDGAFDVIPVPPIPLDALVTTTANSPFLLAWLAMNAADEGELVILDAPVEICFTLSPVATDPVILLPRRDYAAPVVVSDTRNPSTPWILYAKISGPLETPSGYTLAQAVVFADALGGLTALDTDTPLAVGSGGPRIDDDPFTRVTWDEDRGILARIQERIYAGEEYSTRILWGVEPAD